jgi:hypothetical protein
MGGEGIWGVERLNGQIKPMVSDWDKATRMYEEFIW